MESLQKTLDILKFSDAWKILLIPICMMGIDILTGFLKAWKSKTIRSSKLRDGLVKKSGEIIIIFVFMFLQYGIGAPKEITQCVALYIIIMETISIIENVHKLGVTLPDWLTKHLKEIINDGNNSTE